MRCLLGPYPPGFSRELDLRGFHHWFTAHYAFLPCLPSPDRLAVPIRLVVVGAAPALARVSEVRLPPASRPAATGRLVGPFIPPDLTAPRGALPALQNDLLHRLAFLSGHTCMNRFARTGETADPCGVPLLRCSRKPSGCCSGAASHRFTYNSTQRQSVTASTALTIRSHGTSSKNFWTSKSMIQSYFRHRCRQAASAS